MPMSLNAMNIKAWRTAAAHISRNCCKNVSKRMACIKLMPANGTQSVSTNNFACGNRISDRHQVNRRADDGMRGPKEELKPSYRAQCPEQVQVQCPGKFPGNSIPNSAYCDCGSIFGLSGDKRSFTAPQVNSIKYDKHRTLRFRMGSNHTLLWTGTNVAERNVSYWRQKKLFILHRYKIGVIPFSAVCLVRFSVESICVLTYNEL